MTSRQLAVRCARLCDEMKAENIVVLDLRKLTVITDFFVVASTRADRQSRAIAEELIRAAKGLGLREMGREGSSEGKWILQDLGAVVVHLFLDDQRGFYDIESLWADAPRLAWAPARRKTGSTE
ncbi:MAG: ribosome silencing factor [Planctomycetes bacterium]|nr:ribosome silencing factor [Planctomycetota bacterium]